MIRIRTLYAADLTPDILDDPTIPANVKEHEIIPIINEMSESVLAANKNSWSSENKELFLNKYKHKKIEFYYDDGCDDDILVQTNT